MKNKKFDAMVLNYINGNLQDFRHTLRRLDRSQLMQFCVFCDVYYKNELDIYEIDRQFHVGN